MSVIGEVVGIVACVAGVISAYRDGGAIIQSIKVKRAAIRAPPPPRLLEESIDQAPEEIEREKQRGITRFGRAFAEGDHIAVIALQQITIQLQGSLLAKLRNATLDDEVVTDFTFLVDAADLGRDQTISTLLDLRQRLLQASSINELQPPTSIPTQRHSSEPKLPQAPTKASQSQPLLQIRSSQEPTRRPTSPPPAIPKLYKTWTREVSGSRETSGGEDTASGADDTNLHAHRKRHGSLLGFFRHHRSHSSSGDQVPKAAQQSNRNPSSPATSTPFSPPVQCDASEQQAGGQARDPQYTYADWEDDPAAIWGPPKAPENQRRDTMASMNAPPDSLPSPVNTMRTLSIAGSPASPALGRTSTPQNPIPNPTPENDYLNFCKSAWKLQNGDRKAMQRCKEFNDGWSQSNVYFLACAHSKCAFAGHIALDVIWDKVWTVESKGIKFRWPFLAKSHVTQSKVKDHQYAYQCMFCVFRGAPSPVYFGTDTYLEHVRQHRSQPLGEVVCYKATCIADRVADDTEQFDINLFPLGEEERVVRRQSEVLSDDLMEVAKKSTDAQDSMFGANEPWNEGLSDFQCWGDGLERAELE
ncbi:hypothetical protein LTR08_004581 [Meristemomyces frigidus]|nr:hypothetical protein LTR08_004581 [Meristemomyces frigidus]